MQDGYTGVDEQIDYLNPGWRAEFKFLYELCRSYEFYKVSFFFILYYNCLLKLFYFYQGQ